MVLVILFIFFLFKQKTAYEMRISDWSSDVCSSDLPNIAADTVTRTATGRDNETTLLINQFDGTARFSTGPVNHTLVAGVELSREEVDNQAIEIGRASVRERVFTYV